MSANVNLNEWSSFRSKSLTLSSDLLTMVDEMDPIMDGDLSDGAKQAEMKSLMEKYLP